MVVVDLWVVDNWCVWIIGVCGYLCVCVDSCVYVSIVVCVWMCGTSKKKRVKTVDIDLPNAPVDVELLLTCGLWIIGVYV